MLDENELLFDELYEKTKDCGRVQFIKLLMSKEREIQDLKEELKKIKQPTIFVDTQDMEERYGEQLYQDYLVEENKNLQQELTNLKAIEKQHQRINGELREVNKLLNEQYISLYNNYCEELKRKNEAIEYIESKNNGMCIVNGEEKGAYTFLLDFNKSRKFIWNLLDILKGGSDE